MEQLTSLESERTMLMVLLFWIGLNHIYQLTNQQEMKLYISGWNDPETSITWNYQTFKISGPENKYRLTVSGGSVRGDGNGQYFSTYDRDNDEWSSDCAYHSQGGWWYKSCAHAKPEWSPSSVRPPWSVPKWTAVEMVQ